MPNGSQRLTATFPYAVVDQLERSAVVLDMSVSELVVYATLHGLPSIQALLETSRAIDALAPVLGASQQTSSVVSCASSVTAIPILPVAPLVGPPASLPVVNAKLGKVGAGAKS